MSKKDKQPTANYELTIMAAIGDVASSLLIDDKKAISEQLYTLSLQCKLYHEENKREVVISSCDEIRFKDYTDFIDSLRIFAFGMGIFERIEAFKKQFEIE